MNIEWQIAFQTLQTSKAANENHCNRTTETENFTKPASVDAV